MNEEKTIKYVFLATGMVPGATPAPTVSLSNNLENFTLTALSSLVLDATTGIKRSDEVLGLVTFNIKPAADVGGIFDRQVPITLATGSGAEPHILDNPVVFEGGTEPVCEMTNISTDKTYTVYVVMHGRRTKKPGKA